MHTPLAVLDLFSARTIFHGASVAFAGLGFALFGRTISQLRPLGVRESESLMNFSSLGTLTCICNAEQSELDFADRRLFCRGCGCEVIAKDQAMLTKELSHVEIRAMTRSLRQAAIRASNLELPTTISSLDELERYLDDPEPKTPRTPPTQSTPVEHPQIH